VKLASLKSGRDGRLVVVSRDLRRATDAGAIATTLQSALDDWQRTAPKLRELAETLRRGNVEDFAFDPAECAAPLPRAYQWIDGSAYVNHVELMRRSRGDTLPESYFTEPLIYQGASDQMLGPRAPLACPDEAFGIDIEAEIGVIMDDVPLGVTAAEAANHIKLYTLLNDISLRRLIPPELAKGFGFFQGKPATAFAGVVVTPDELGGAERAHTIARPLQVDINGQPFGRARPDLDQVFTFVDLIVHAARTRSLGAGTILGGGTVSNKLDGGPGRTLRDGGAGYSCIAEQRAVERLRTGAAQTSFLRDGDTIRLEMLHEDGTSIFGSIEQTVQILS